MKTNEINIRDPFILTYEGVYYMYGTRSATCWGPAEGFDCYKSSDMEEWEGPLEVFKRPEGFFADREYWAPECIFHEGYFYLIATLGSANRKKGIYILRSRQPEGPFEPYSECLTPSEWVCIDGNVYFEKEKPILFFSHSFEDVPDGDMCMLPLSADLRHAAGEPVIIFSAKEAAWAKPVPFAKAEFGMEGDVYFTDGPCVVNMGDKKLYMTWSSWGDCGYAVGLAVSESGEAKGPWRQIAEPVWPVNGGHGMLFQDLAGQLWFTLHSPNDKYKERPLFVKAFFDENGLRLEKNKIP